MKGSSNTPWRRAGWAIVGVGALAGARITVRPAAQTTSGFATYDYAGVDEGQEKAVRLAIPADLETVRGLLVNTNAAGGDRRARYTLPYLRAFAALHGFAFLGARGFNCHPGSVTVVEHALARFAAKSGHAELLNATLVAYVFSQAQRPRGAHFAWAMVEGQGHAETDQATLAIPFLDRCIRLRYSPEADLRRGPVALRPLELSSDWLASNTTWHSGLTRIAPHSDPGTAAVTTSWLPDEDTVFIYRAYATFAPALRLTTPPSGAAWVLALGPTSQSPWTTRPSPGGSGWRSTTGQRRWQRSRRARPASQWPT